MTEPVFACRMHNAHVLKRVVQALREMITEANFDCTSTGMQLQAMDESHTCLVIVDLQKEGFEEYACDTLLSLGLNIDHFKKLLEPVEPGSAMEL
eukprot:CAMPEP_0174372384 /NCGR_PEP_ID=MMETSP0811_2-20130205/103412_1 /TAXON_ID=73025 ORGANISM="Eutreptiella gymnastica-like, Strain CCMP1594" /NCGR_SAMPLE_ID=MMETSP0811_2 /ASSEMBLY_ACC=CAM_ASM_000667 /LENGTH=94 /DNA_ID=CAMNT_0015519753 /DNA_START=37 /DNA_END=318 /DNA_ORIENTATION=-